MARHGGQQVIDRLLDPPRVTLLHQIRQHVAHDRRGVAACQETGNRAQRQLIGRKPRHAETQCRKFLRVRLGRFGLRRGDVQDFRDEQLLLRRLSRQQLLHALVHHPLVRGVHIHQHHAVGGLRQDIDAVQLRDRISQRRAAAGRVAIGAVQVLAGEDCPSPNGKLRAGNQAAVGIGARPRRLALRQREAHLGRGRRRQRIARCR